MLIGEMYGILQSQLNIRVTGEITKRAPDDLPDKILIIDRLFPQSVYMRYIRLHTMKEVPKISKGKKMPMKIKMIFENDFYM